jgi:site-specific DNA-cytosine methylase
VGHAAHVFCFQTGTASDIFCISSFNEFSPMTIAVYNEICSSSSYVTICDVMAASRRKLKVYTILTG